MKKYKNQSLVSEYVTTLLPSTKPIIFRGGRHCFPLEAQNGATRLFTHRDIDRKTKNNMIETP